MIRHLVSMLSLFGSSAPPAPRGVPRRVQRLIEAAEDQSERLIGWVQLFVVGSLAVLYLLAPRPTDAPPGSLLDPVPAALLVYALFTVGRLWFAYRQRLPGILLLVSILADVVLLVGLIWSFHAQYGQPPPFSLKVPTFVYFFVFIAIRALRFDHRYVLAAGLAAAAGWVLLVIAVLEVAGAGAITRSFIVHVNASRVLIGAEFDKVMALLLVTGVLALAVYRGRRLFITAIRDEAALEDLERFLGKGVSDAVVEAELEAEPGMAVEREAAIIMLDIRGFTQLTSGLSPRSVVAILTGLHARIIPIVRSNGGIIDKFMGDGIMATFGAVSPSATAAADALRALDAIMIEAGKWQLELRALGERAEFRLQGSVVAGPVLFAIVGSGIRMEYTVIGEAVNLAAKLEKHNKLQGTRALTTRETLEAALRQGYLAPAAPALLSAQAIAGVAKPIDIVVMAP